MQTEFKLTWHFNQIQFKAIDELLWIPWTKLCVFILPSPPIRIGLWRRSWIIVFLGEVSDLFVPTIKVWTVGTIHQLLAAPSPRHQCKCRATPVTSSVRLRVTPTFDLPGCWLLCVTSCESLKSKCKKKGRHFYDFRRWENDAGNIKKRHMIVEVWVCSTCSTRPGRQKSRFKIESTSLDSASQTIQIVNSSQIVAGLGRAAGCFSLGAQTGQRFITGCTTMSCDSHRSKLGQ